MTAHGPERRRRAAPAGLLVTAAVTAQCYEA